MECQRAMAGQRAWNYGVHGRRAFLADQHTWKSSVPAGEFSCQASVPGRAACLGVQPACQASVPDRLACLEG
jgi:hypothetical protein